MELPLSRELSLSVGDDGIIGRRVTVWLQNSENLIAEGVVGFN